MAAKPPSKPPSSDNPVPASADEPAAPELEKKPAAGTGAGAPIPDGKATGPVPSDADDDEHELDIDNDEDDEDLVLFIAKEAAGALARVYAFFKPYLKNYKKMLTFVGIGVIVETLFNV